MGIYTLSARFDCGVCVAIIALLKKLEVSTSCVTDFPYLTFLKTMHPSPY